METKKPMDEDTRKLALCVLYMSMLVIVLFAFAPLI